MGATDDQLDFPHLYASGKQGWAVVDMNDPHVDLAPLYDLIVSHVPPYSCFHSWLASILC